MNSRAAISGFEAPSPARRAISASCAVRVSGVSMVCGRAGAGQVHPQPGTAEAVDRLAVELLGGCAVADQRPRAGLSAKRPVGPARAGDAGEPLNGAGRALGY